jgi:hypothetical protein
VSGLESGREDSTKKQWRSCETSKAGRGARGESGEGMDGGCVKKDLRGLSGRFEVEMEEAWRAAGGSACWSRLQSHHRPERPVAWHARLPQVTGSLVGRERSRSPTYRLPTRCRAPSDTFLVPFVPTNGRGPIGTTLVAERQPYPNLVSYHFSPSPAAST